ncbi:MAG: glycosyltransferase family 4 protein [Acidimicrobiia bacterium]
MTIRRLHIVAWRDLDDPGAGGSEIHINELARRWAAGGLDVTLRTGAVQGAPSDLRRDGYRVVRRGGPYTGFVRAPGSELLRLQGPSDALVEVWHGVSFLAPLWFRGPRVGIAHHVHAEQFQFVLPRPAARLAEVLERDVYPRLYRNTPLVTLSDSNRDELVALGYPAANMHVIPPGLDERFTPGGTKADSPTVLVVGRLMPQKRVEVVAEALAPLRATYPDLELLVIGDGPDRARIEPLLPGWVRLMGWVDHAGLLDAYRTAWVASSASIAEGWNMTLTEAGACGTPAVATRIPGHTDAVADGVTGILADDVAGLTSAFAQLLGDAALRARFGAAAAEHAHRFTWDGGAAAFLDLLERQVIAAP